jgi:hypothetical protein
LPDSFVRSDWKASSQDLLLPACLRQAGKTCDAYLLDLSGDGKPELIIVGTTREVGAAVLGENDQGQWKRLAGLPYFLAGCASVRQNLIAGNFRSVAPALQDLEVSGLRISVNSVSAGTEPCPAR